MTTTTKTTSRALAGALLVFGLAACGDDGHDHDHDQDAGTDTSADASTDVAPDTTADVGIDTTTDTTPDTTADTAADTTTGCTVTPDTWDATDFATNAAGALALRDAIDNLQSTLMNAAEQNTWGDTPTDAPTLDDLIAAYEAGDPSVADVTSDALDAIVRDVLDDWVAALAEDPAAYAFIDEDGTEWIATGVGALYERPPADDGTRRFRAYSNSGVELRQIIDKGLFVGALYNYALSLTEGEITPATVQALAAAWGANTDLNVSPGEDDEANTDSSNYARTMGLYDETADALIAAQAYAADEACAAELDAAIVTFFRWWEEAMFARGTYYSGAPWRATLDATDPETIFGPLHGAAEGWGLIAGLLDLDVPESGPLAGAPRIATDDDIIDAISALGVDLTDISAGTTGEWLVEEPATYNTAFEGTFKTTVQDVFGWDDELFNVYATSPVANE